MGPAVAQTSLYEQNMRLGRMFQASGNLRLAEQCYETALRQASENDPREQLDAKQGLVDAMKMLRPVEAQHLNDLLEQSSRSDAARRQQFLAANCYISFQLNNRAAFNRAYEEYLELCSQQSELPTDNDLSLQAMHEAFEGYYSQAFGTLARAQTDPLTRHDMRITLFKMSSDTARVIQEQQLRALTVDSLAAAMYQSNLDAAAATTAMTRAQQQAERKNANLTRAVVALGALIVLLLLAGLYARRRIRRTLEVKNDQLKTALKMAGETEAMKTEFVQRVSHEIRTPLNAITGFNDILNNSDIELAPEERGELMKRLGENVKAITVIVDELLQAADAKSTIDYAKNDTVLCNQFFSDLIYRHRNDVNANIELKYTTQLINRFTILTNREAVQKIVLHLIHNAIKFTQRGTIELNCREERGMIFIAVTDTGCGIPQEKQDEVFEQFSKVDAHQQGIGLGLTVSRNVAQKMGGDLTLDKDYTQGARFVLSLPVK